MPIEPLPDRVPHKAADESGRDDDLMQRVRVGDARALARQWNLVTPGGERWNALIDEFLELDFVLDPTMTIYAAGRHVMAARNADWMDEYALPSLWDFFQPSREAHGSYWFDWTTHDEVAWRNYYDVWMQFLNDYKNAGGRVTTGSDSGFIYKLYGFGYIEESSCCRRRGSIRSR